MTTRSRLMGAATFAALAVTSASAFGQAMPAKPMPMAAAMDMSMGMDPSGVGKRVRITYQNLTTGQALSPSAFITHNSSAMPLFAMGEKASFGVMRLAEEGAGGPAIEAAAKMGKSFGTAAAAIPILPGQSMSVDIEVTRDHPMVSGAFMLVNTNDGFTGVNGVNAFSLTRPMSMDLMAMDAGTERNNERKAYLIAMMGPDRDPEGGVITRHTGIRADADAPAMWKFDPSKPVARISFTPIR